jgi:hypothetical protein
MKLDSYNIIKDYINSGDVLAFSGKGRISSIIKIATCSSISHVGMALWMDGELYSAESTTLSNVQDISGEFRKGFQIVKMDDRIANYDGKAWLARLHEPLADHEELVLKSFLLKCHKQRIQYDTVQAIEAGVDCKFVEWVKYKLHIKKKNDLTRVFCSEIAAAALEQVGRLDQNVDASELTPKDVVKLSCFEKGLYKL